MVKLEKRQDVVYSFSKWDLQSRECGFRWVNTVDVVQRSTVFGDISGVGMSACSYIMESTGIPPNATRQGLIKALWLLIIRYLGLSFFGGLVVFGGLGP